MEGQRTNGSVRAVPDDVGVLVVDPQRVVGEAVAAAVAATEGFHVVGVATSMREAEELVGDAAPDVVVTDCVLPDGDGFALTRQVLRVSPRTRVVVLTGDVASHRILEAAEAGACGFASKQGSLGELLHALATARQGGMVVAATTLAESLTRAAGPTAAISRAREAAGRTARVGGAETAGTVRLTTREREVLELFADGYDVPAASRALGITVNTCRGYVKALHTKLGAHSQLEAVAVARRSGLLRTA